MIKLFNAAFLFARIVWRRIDENEADSRMDWQTAWSVSKGIWFGFPEQPVGFVCNGCKHELPSDYSMRTKGYCYLCDPNISVDELLEKQVIASNNKTSNWDDESSPF